ncbi:MAG: hypothetical protein WDZ42_00350 [Candidatus Saccharimonadales bacterium]
MIDTALIVLGAALLLGLIAISLMRKTTKPKTAAVDKQFIKDKWAHITRTANSPSANLAIVEADKLLDYVLKKRGYSGETMGDRLKSAGGDFTYINDVWEAHKLRNKIVHEADYEVDQRLVGRSLEQFKQALKDLGVM